MNKVGFKAIIVRFNVDRNLWKTNFETHKRSQRKLKMGASNAWQEKDGLPNQIHSLASENKPSLIYSIFLYILYLKSFEIKNENFQF